MADETTDATSTDTTDETSTEETTDTSATQESDTEQPKPQTPEELQAAVVSLQSQLSKVNRESQDRRKKLDTLETAQQTAEDAEKTELQKAQDDLAALNTKLEEKETVARRYETLSAIRSKGSAAKVLFNEDALSIAYDAGCFKSVEYDDNGKPANLDAVMKEVVKTYPFILQSKAPAPDINSQSGGGGNGQLMSDDEFAKNALDYGVKVSPKQ